MDLNIREQNYQNLIACLDQLVKVYRTLLDVVRKEKDILIASHMEQLNENNRTKEAVLIKIRSLETQRMKCAKDLAVVIGAETDRPRLTEIASHFQDEKAEKLRTAHSVLELLVKRVAEINKSNESLVKSALAAIQGAMNSIRESAQPKNTYENHGKLKSQSGGGTLVKREA